MEEKPKSTKADKAHKTTKIILSGIPFVGGPVAELFNTIIAPPLAKRRDKWLESLYEGLKMLEEKVDGFNIEDLKDNEMFITTVMHATQVAVRNHQKEKLEVLRNAVLNAALPNAPEEDLQLIFLNWVDDLTQWHLNILKFFEDPKGWGEKHNFFPNFKEAIDIPKFLLSAFKELRRQDDFANHIVKDLNFRGLINIEGIRAHRCASELIEPRTTEVGEQFIQFITSPIEE